MKHYARNLVDVSIYLEHEGGQLCTHWRAIPVAELPQRICDFIASTNLRDVAKIVIE